MIKRNVVIIFNCLCLLLLFSLTARAGASQFQIGLGQRNDKISWNIAGDLNGENPNILSELTWNDLDSTALTLNLRHQLGRDYIAMGQLLLGRVDTGVVQDSDYLTDDRTSEFSRSYSDASDSEILDWSLGIGRTLFSAEGWELGAMLGYASQRQNLRISDGYQTIPVLAPLIGLESSYQTNWRGPWIGIAIKKNWRRLHFQGGLGYHWTNYYGEGDWNLRDDLAHPVSFIHRADGSGISLGLGLAYALNDHWSLGLNYQRAKWRTDPGRDVVFGADGTSIDTRLNEVRWSSQMITFTANVYF